MKVIMFGILMFCVFGPLCWMLILSLDDTKWLNTNKKDLGKTDEHRKTENTRQDSRNGRSIQ